MKKVIVLVPILAICILLFKCRSQNSTVERKGSIYKVYFLGGQSNMEGYGYNSDLPKKYQSKNSNVMVFNGNTVSDDSFGGGNGSWLPLSPGFGAGYRATIDSVFLSDRFGPEVSFGQKLFELSNEKIAIIKYARGGSSIELGASQFGAWKKDYNQNTRINQWDYFENTVDNALDNKDIDGDGIVDTLIPSGILWMQGEADACNEAASKVYLENLTVLMNDIEAKFGTRNLPIVIGRIEDGGQKPQERMMAYLENVWKAQENFAKQNKNVHIVKLSQPITFIADKWHYKSKHYIELGNLFAQKVFETQK